LLTVGTKNRDNDAGAGGGGVEGTATGETDGSPVQATVETRENGNNQGRTNATSTNDTTKMMGCRVTMQKRDTLKCDS
jgi:hypothetical protein